MSKEYIDGFIAEPSVLKLWFFQYVEYDFSRSPNNSNGFYKIVWNTIYKLQGSISTIISRSIC